MNIIFINHGSSMAKDLGLVEGRADYPLNKEGKEVASKIAEFITKNFKTSRIYTSPLKRAMETADYTSKLTGIEVDVIDDLIEMNNGRLAGLKIHEAKELRMEEEIPGHTSSHSMEPMMDFKLRGAKVLNRIMSENSEGDFLLVFSHGSLIQQMIRAFLELPLTSDLLIASLPGSISQVFIFSGKKGLVQVNSVSHLL